MPAVVALNRFAGDSEADLEGRARLLRVARRGGGAVGGLLKGGEGMADLARKVVAAADAPTPSTGRAALHAGQTFEEKITEIATKVYGAARWRSSRRRRSRLQQYAALGYGHLPVCIAKTQYSFTDDPKVMGAPTGWTLTITDATLSAGAGFVVAIAGSMMLMPGLGKVPQAQKLDVNDDGDVVGMDYYGPAERGRRLTQGRGISRSSSTPSKRARSRFSTSRSSSASSRAARPPPRCSSAWRSASR